jgi:hypothetical protein
MAYYRGAAVSDDVVFSRGEEAARWEEEIEQGAQVYAQQTEEP